MLEFQVLGSFRVVAEGRPLSLGGRKQCALLALLVLQRNRVVPRERLVDALWRERPPVSALNGLQVYVSRLRRLLNDGEHGDGGLLVSHAAGYLLHLSADAVDAGRFEHLLAEGGELLAAGDAGAADEVLGRALALWRGPALPEFASEPFAQPEIARLEELRLRALEARLEAAIARGRHAEALGELQALVAQHPLEERFRRQLMLALYRQGRQADALAVYQDARRTLTEQLGLEPGRELQDLERAVLVHDPALELPARPTPATESGAAAMVRGPRRLQRRLALFVAAALPLAVALGLAFAFHREGAASLSLVPNSVGFVDANSGRLTRQFAVGREPSSLTVAYDSVWAANYRDQTVTRINRASGTSVTIPAGGHPTGLTAYQGKIWVWTLERRLLPIDPRYERTGRPIRLGARIGRLIAPTPGVAPASTHPGAPERGSITSGGGYLWITVPPVYVIRVDPAEPERLVVIAPNDGARGAIAYHDGNAWVAGYDDVFPIAARTGPGSGILVGGTRDIAFGLRSVWVVGGGQDQGIVMALRRVDIRGRLVRTTIEVGSDPVAVAAADRSIWVASRSDRTIRRVDVQAAGQPVVETIPLGAGPTALAADVDLDGVWVAVE